MSSTHSDVPPVPSRTAAVLVAAPTDVASVLPRVAGTYAAGESVVVVTAHADAGETAATYREVDPSPAAVGVVDTTAGQNVVDVCNEVPVVRTPAVGDLARTAVGVRNLAAELPGETTLVVPSLGPFLRAADPDRFTRMVDRLAGGPVDRAVIGVDYTETSARTLDSLAATASGLLWVRPDTEGGISFEYERR